MIDFNIILVIQRVKMNLMLSRFDEFILIKNKKQTQIKTNKRTKHLNLKKTNNENRDFAYVRV